MFLNTQTFNKYVSKSLDNDHFTELFFARWIAGDKINSYILQQTVKIDPTASVNKWVYVNKSSHWIGLLGKKMKDRAYKAFPESLSHMQNARVLA